jgi:hypothetical protein
MIGMILRVRGRCCPDCYCGEETSGHNRALGLIFLKYISNTFEAFLATRAAISSQT